MALTYEQITAGVDISLTEVAAAYQADTGDDNDTTVAWLAENARCTTDEAAAAVALIASPTDAAPTEGAEGNAGDGDANSGDTEDSTSPTEGEGSEDPAPAKTTRSRSRAS